jgi:hypothetical protein
VENNKEEEKDLTSKGAREGKEEVDVNGLD